MNDDSFEWDNRKAARNLAKHAISFEVAREAFDDPCHIEELDERGDYGEDRFNAIGLVKGRLLVVTYTLRETRVRIISARMAEPKERRQYHEKRN
jgi:uncharacterized protein